MHHRATWPNVVGVAEGDAQLDRGDPAGEEGEASPGDAIPRRAVAPRSSGCWLYSGMGVIGGEIGGGIGGGRDG